MSLSLTARELGFNAILGVSGECVVLLLGERILCSATALVNRGGEAAPLEKGQVDWDERNRSRVEVAKTIATVPVVGATWKDSTGVFHRIKSVKSTDVSYVTICEPAEADDDE